MSYRWIEPTKLVRRLADGACIPADSGNRDYQEVRAWVAAGNTITAAPPPVVPPHAARHAALLAEMAAAGAMERLRNATPAQIDAFMDANVTDLASARAVLKVLGKALAYLARGHENA